MGRCFGKTKKYKVIDKVIDFEQGVVGQDYDLFKKHPELALSDEEIEKGNREANTGNKTK